MVGIRRTDRRSDCCRIVVSPRCDSKSGRQAVQGSLVVVTRDDLPAYSDWGGYDNWFKMNLRTVYRYYAGTG